MYPGSSSSNSWFLSPALHLHSSLHRLAQGRTPLHRKGLFFRSTVLMYLEGAKGTYWCLSAKQKARGSVCWFYLFHYHISFSIFSMFWNTVTISLLEHSAKAGPGTGHSLASLWQWLPL